MKTDGSHFTLIIRKKKNKRRERGERDVRKGRRRKKKKKRLKSKRKARQWPGNLAEGSRAGPGGLAARPPVEQGGGAHPPRGRSELLISREEGLPDSGRPAFA